jgi:hypothetical protein
LNPLHSLVSFLGSLGLFTYGQLNKPARGTLIRWICAIAAVILSIILYFVYWGLWKQINTPTPIDLYLEVALANLFYLFLASIVGLLVAMAPKGLFKLLNVFGIGKT